MRYTDLVFDLYGTLVDIHTDEGPLAWEKTALYFGYYGAHFSGETLRKAFDAEMNRREARAGQGYEMFPDIPFDQVLADLFRAKGVTDNADALGLHAAQVFRATATEYLRLYDGVPKALAYLRSQGFRLWLLSNAQRAFTAYELRHLELGPQFDGVYLSSDHQCRKPDLRFYNALISDHHLDPAACLMIGNDRETDITGAINAGMATLYMHTNLTPAHQADADPAMHPAANCICRHYEYEGANWHELSRLIRRVSIA